MAAGLERRFEAVGLKPLQDEEALNALERLLQRGRGGVVTVMVADWSRLARRRCHDRPVGSGFAA